MKKKNVMRFRFITSIVFLIISLSLIIIGFQKEYMGSPLFSCGVGGLVVSLWQLRTVWIARASQTMREELVINDSDERNIQINTKSEALAYNISVVVTLAAAILCILLHEDTIGMYFMMLLGVQICAYFLLRFFYTRKL